MSTHTNYTRLIASILSLKRYLPNVQDMKYDQFKEFLNSCQHDSLDESWDNVPETKDIATVLGISKQRVYKLIKGLYAELKMQFDTKNPIEIKRVVHLIYIGVPYEEIKEYPNQKYAQEELYRSTNVYMRLPVTPRTGEHIN